MDLAELAAWFAVILAADLASYFIYDFLTAIRGRVKRAKKVRRLWRRS